MAAYAIDWAVEGRSEPRDVVHHRTRATHADGRWLSIVIVNISSGGLMARCEMPCAEGDRLRIDLPRVGQVFAEVRWALGGRLGCQFEEPLGLTEFEMLRSRMRR